MHINLLVLSEHVCKIITMIYAVEVGCNILHLVDHRSKFIFFEQVVELVTVLDLQRRGDHARVIRILLVSNKEPTVQYHIDFVMEDIHLSRP